MFKKILRFSLVLIMFLSIVAVNAENVYEELYQGEVIQFQKVVTPSTNSSYEAVSFLNRINGSHETTYCNIMPGYVEDSFLQDICNGQVNLGFWSIQGVSWTPNWNGTVYGLTYYTVNYNNSAISFGRDTVKKIN